MRTRDDTLEAEAAVLGAVLASDEVAGDLLMILKGDDFLDTRHRVVWRAVELLHGRGAPTELPAVTRELNANDKLNAAGGAAFVSSLVDALPDVANAEYYAHLVAKDSRDRKAIAELRLATQAILDGQHAADVLPLLLAKMKESDVDLSGIRSLWGPVGFDALSTKPLPRRWLLHAPDGEGLLPLGRAGILSAEGGAGKTSALLSLAVSVITGRSWFGRLGIGADAEGGRVALLLGEEEREEIHRRLWTVAQALDLSDDERRAVSELVVAVPLAGHPVSLLTMVNGNPVESGFLGEVRRQLEDGGPWALVVLDPLSRFSAGGTESDNETATRFFQVAESLCRTPGGPTVLVAAHSSKLSRRMGEADVRGVSGLTDAARWVATLKKSSGNVVVFEQVKSNYSRPCDPVPLVWRDGVLVGQVPEDVEAAAEIQRVQESQLLDDDIRRVVDALTREGGLGSKNAIAKAAGLRAQRGRDALDLAVARGLVIRTGTARDGKYEVTGGPAVCVASPHTPRDRGTASLGSCPDPVQRTQGPIGTDSDRGTASSTGTTKNEHGDDPSYARTCSSRARTCMHAQDEEEPGNVAPFSDSGGGLSQNTNSISCGCGGSKS
jgi:hypothetical protein